MSGLRHILEGDLRGARAVTALPLPHAQAEEIEIDLLAVGEVDAVTACVLLGYAAYATNFMFSPTRLVMPADADARDLLWGLLPQMPNRALLEPGRPESPPWIAPPTAILPVTLFETPRGAGVLADQLHNILADVCEPNETAFLAGALAQMAENSCVHGGDSPIRSAAAVSWDAASNSLQAVVHDLGQSVGVAEHDAEQLLSLWWDGLRDGHSPGGLESLVSEAAAGDLDVEVAIWAEEGRLLWRTDCEVEIDFGPEANGFTAAVTLHRAGAGRRDPKG